MARVRNDQRKQVFVNFSNENAKTAIIVDHGLSPPMFRDVSRKIPLVVACVIFAQIVLLAIISYAVFIEGFTLDYLSDEAYEIPCFGSTMPSTVLLAFAGVASLWAWEMNVARRAPHLNIEMTFHRIIRLFILFAVITLGLINSFQCVNLYTLMLEMVLIFILFLVESTYHAMFLVYLFELDKFTREQRRNCVELKVVKSNASANDSDSKVSFQAKELENV